MATPLLFLIADTGGGHRASANAVKHEIETRWPGEYDIRILDPFAESAPRMIGRVADLYGPIIKHARWFWGALYYSTNSRAGIATLRGSVLRAVKKGLRDVLEEMRPAAVVSFHPLLNHITVRILRSPGIRSAPFMTVITDLVDVHAGWASRGADAVVVPSVGGVDRCRRAGIPAHRVHQLGLPVHPSFTGPPASAEERRALRERLGLPPDAFVVLLASGADGSGGLDRRTIALAESGLDIEIVVVCGRNERVRERLSGLEGYRGRPVRVLGFVTNMAEWMRASDLMVTKAGPGTIAEALCCGLPLLLTMYLPGQERGNVEWVVDVGAGRYVPGLSEMVDTVAELSEAGSRSLQAMRETVREVARPDSTGRIADLIRELAQPPSAVPA